MSLALELKDISKSFPGVKALDSVSLSLKSGLVHGLVGENGAGKSTLIKILAGVYPDYDGEISLFGKPVKIISPHDSQNKRISVIFQELTIIPGLSVAENIFLGREPTRISGIINKKIIAQKGKEILNFLGCNFKLSDIAGKLSIANQQLVEICKALILNAEIIIMDEPTASITKAEVKNLFDQIKKLKESGKTIIYVSHRIEEVFEICDTISILRDGKLVGSLPKEETDQNKVINMMVGRSVDFIYPSRDTKPSDVIFSVKNLTKKGFFENISFDLKKGEILGFAGLVGAGRSEVGKALIGFFDFDSGYVNFFKKNKLINYVFKHPRQALNEGIAYLPEDRKKEGLFHLLSVKENITISALLRCVNFGFYLDNKKEKNLADFYINKIMIKTPSLEQNVSNLSGGNQQKTIISRLLSTNANIFIFDEPTRGIDVGAKFEIYNIMNDLVSEGKSIIFISSELPELMGISDRIILMRSGRIVGEIIKNNFDAEIIMKKLVEG